ncbi:peptidoglycan DD-metalloendopeptidase family protein [Lachnospiraceae bacterium 48-33]
MRNTKLIAGLSAAALTAMGVTAVALQGVGKQKSEQNTENYRTESEEAEYTGNLFASSSLLSSLYENLENNPGLDEQTGALICSKAGMSEAIEGYGTYIALADEATGSASIDALDMALKFVPKGSVLEGYTNLGVSKVTTYLNVRDGIGTDKEIIGKMPGGSACEILGEQDGWYQIRSGEVEGYVDKQYILSGYEANAEAMKLTSNVLQVNADNLNIRSEATTDSPVVTKVNTGDILDILGEAEDWYHISINGQEGYVKAEYVLNLSTLPTAEKISSSGERGDTDNGSGSYFWPLSGYSSISSSFSTRSNPFGGRSTEFHNGIDIPAPSGTSIMAVSNGWVAWSSYSSSAGNWIGIDHGNGVYSIYMHMSSRIAQTGDYVEAGQVIGLVGSTGRSTGAHLHLSICVDEIYVNPLDYVLP